jgi:hypothetical protein
VVVKKKLQNIKEYCSKHNHPPTIMRDASNKLTTDAQDKKLAGMPANR